MDVQTVESTPDTAGATAVQDGQAALVGNGTPENTSGQASPQGQSATAEESFTGVDPKTLTPEMQAVYKSLQSDYTKKTQAIAEERKRLPDLEQKAKSYDQLTSDQRVKDYLAGLSRGERSDFREQKAEAEKRLGEKISDADFAKAFESKDNFLDLLQRVVEDKRAGDQKEIAELKQEVTLNKVADIIASVETELDKTTKQLVRPDFQSLEEDKLISGYLHVNPAQTLKEYRERTIEAYNWAKSVSSKYYEKGKAEALKIVQTKSQNSSEPPTVTSKGAYTGPDPKKVDVSEAVALARKGIRVPHN